jgi:Sortase domain
MTRRGSRTSVPLVAGLLLAGVFATAIGLGQSVGLPRLPSFSHPDSDPGMKPSQPVRISIPTLGVRANVVEVGRADDGSIATPVEDPAGTAGWYGLGPTPGETGTAVIVGHVDTASRPAVFQRLGELKAGKVIEVSRKDRKVATFKVESVERFPKTSFPADRVFDAADGARLALVTCGGEWVGGDTGYADNVIVFARAA